jgi:hypothetical protein
MRIRTLDAHDIPNGMAAHLEMMRTGQPSTPRTPLYADAEPSEVFKRWFEILSEHQHQLGFGELIAYEEKKLEKTGPKGDFPPLSERREALAAYYNGNPDIRVSDGPALRKAIQMVRNILFGNIHSVRMFTIAQVIEQGDQDNKLITNSGDPLWGKRNDSQTRISSIRDVRSGKWKNYRMVIGSRNERGKPRFIFMAPFSMNIKGQQGLYALMKIIRKRNVPSFSAWEGFDAVTTAYHQMQYITAKRKLSTDYEKMDTHCVFWHARNVVLEVLLPVCDGPLRRLLVEVFDHAFELATIIAVDKEAYETHNSLLSGWEWTNAFESILSLVVHIYFLIVSGYLDKWHGSNILGDDGTIAVDTDNELSSDFVAAAADIGLPCNAEKQYESSHEWRFLQRVFIEAILNKNGEVAGIYPGISVLNSAIYPERFHDPRKWSSDMEEVRWWMILENANQHPLFHELIELVAAGDIYSLGRVNTDILDRLDKVEAQARSIPGFVPTYTEAHSRPLRDFDVVRYLKH